MSVGDVAQILTAIGVIISALVGLRNGARINSVHGAVNSTAMDANARTDQLTAALTDADVKVPPRPPPSGGPAGNQKPAPPA